MCAPLACAVLGKRAHFRRAGLWLYQTGRLLSYSLAGAFLGWISATLQEVWSSLGQALTWAIGIGLILAGCARLIPWGSVHIPLYRRLQQLWLPHLQRIPQALGDFGLGLVTVFLPCMTLSPALAFAATTGSAFQGFLFMFAFALGTLPMMAAATNVPLMFYRRLPHLVVRAVPSVFLLLAGMITIYRAISH